MTPTNPELRRFINQFFSDEELDTLCFDYFPEALNDFGGGMSKSRKVIVLIGHCERRDRLPDLLAAVARERSEAWNKTFAAPSAAEKPGFSEKTRFLNERDPRQIFLSHATADAEFAHALAADLRAEGWRVWIAPESIRPGEKWVEAIDRGLETSGVFVVALTPDAVASRWVRTETNAAISMEHQDHIRFIPLDVVECQAPWLWTQYQYIPFRDSYEIGLSELYKRLDALINSDDYVEWLKSLPDKVFPPTKISQTPPIPTPPRERYVKEEQWRQLQALAHQIAAELGRQSGDDELREVYRRFNRHFGLTTYRKLPRRRFGEGLAFLSSWREEVSLNAAGKDTTEIANYKLHEKTGIELVRIPAGPFLYGSSDGDPMASDYEKPQRTIDLPEYWIGRYPVTNAQYKRFVDATGRAAPGHWNGNEPPADKLDHPVVRVTWYDAKAFCDWAGLALLSEEQWEKAARGTDGRLWPWGDEPPTDKHCNFNRNVGSTTPVGKYSPLGDSPWGCADMAGNVWEWTASMDEVPSLRFLRGGSWWDKAQLCRCARRDGYYPDYGFDHIGFRVLVAPS